MMMNILKGHLLDDILLMTKSHGPVIMDMHSNRVMHHSLQSVTLTQECSEDLIFRHAKVHFLVLIALPLTRESSGFCGHPPLPSPDCPNFSA